jgi:hypothetical protein
VESVFTAASKALAVRPYLHRLQQGLTATAERLLRRQVRLQSLVWVALLVALAVTVVIR